MPFEPVIALEGCAPRPDFAAPGIFPDGVSNGASDPSRPGLLRSAGEVSDAASRATAYLESWPADCRVSGVKPQRTPWGASAAWREPFSLPQPIQPALVP